MSKVRVVVFWKLSLKLNKLDAIKMVNVSSLNPRPVFFSVRPNIAIKLTSDRPLLVGDFTNAASLVKNLVSLPCTVTTHKFLTHRPHAHIT